MLVRVGRIELPPDAWEAPVLPLNYTRFAEDFTTQRVHEKLAKKYFLY